MLVCEECKRDFETEQRLRIHNGMKHKARNSHPQNQNNNAHANASQSDLETEV